MLHLPIARFSIALAVLVAAPVSARAFKPVTPAATPFKIGAFQLYALSDLSLEVANDNSVFGLGLSPAAVARVLAAAGAPGDHVTLDVDALLVEMPGHNVLIDTGLGPKIGGVLMASLAKTGVAPAKITDIFITHRHFDHIGGLVTADGALAFPNATIRMSKIDWEGLQDEKDSATLVGAIASKVVPFTPGGELLPGITTVALHGHTPGHVGYQISSQGAKLLDIGDSAHSSIISLAEPAWPISFDMNKQQGEATREQLLKRLAASHERIFAPHFPYPGIGTIVVKGSGYAFKPTAR